MKRESVVDEGVVFERIDLVVAHETFDREAVLAVVMFVEVVGVGGGELEVVGEVFVDEDFHEVVDLLGAGVELWGCR